MSPRPNATIRARKGTVLLLLAALAAPGSAAPALSQQEGAPEEPPPQEEIEKAVRRAVDYLLAHQQRDGSWEHESRRYPTGQTALSAYALLKAGLPLEHPALRRALAFLAADLPAETYSMGCELMLLEATHDPAWTQRIEEITDLLRRIDVGGEWSYPLTHSDPDWIPREGHPDLSNTQYAVLGLRAAHYAGVEVPRRVWQDIVDTALTYQETPRAADPELVLGRKVAGRFNVAGFRYRNDGSGAPTGSMTAAGLTVLGVAQEVLGDKLGARRRRDIEDAVGMGVDWLALNWSVESNPGSGGWHKYYLYGLERVGGVLGIEDFRGHAWFAEGARLLLRTQGDDGNWGSLPDTCFAVLFLRRATAAVKSNISSGLAPEQFSSPEDDEIVMRALGQPVMSLWVEPPSRALRERFPGGILVDDVEYLVDGEVVARVEGDPSEPWENARFPVRHELTSRGRHRVTARVNLAPATGLGAPPALESKGFEVHARYALEDWMLDFAAARTRNQLLSAERSATASSQVSGHEGPEAAFDGLQGTRWLAGREDPQPWIRLDLPRSVRADRIVLTQATPREHYRNYLSRVAVAEVYLNHDSDPLRVELEADEMRPTVLELEGPRNISRLELRILERTPGSAWPDLIGLSEIALELSR